MTSKERYQQLLESKSADAPLCLCGCGQKTKWSIRTKSFGQYLFNHQLPDLSGNWTDFIEQVVRGTIMGDGHLDARHGRKGRETGLSRLAIRHSTKRQLVYAQWLHATLRPITTSNLRIRKTEEAFGDEIAEFATVSLPQLDAIRRETYVGRQKVVTKAFLDKLTDLSVAIWWCDDGSHNSISTHSFTYSENELVSAWLNERYGTITKVVWDRRVNLPYLSCNSQSMRALGPIIFPFVEQSLWYKFGRFLPELLKHGSKTSNKSGLSSPTTSPSLKTTTSSPMVS